MYLQFFNLKEEPFSLTPDPRFFFLSNQHDVAVNALLYGVQSRKGFLMLTGEVGTGKTTVCRTLISKLGQEVELAVILNPLLSMTGLLRAINRDFGNEVKSNSLEKQMEGLNRFLSARVKEGRNAVVLIDEAQNLSVEALEMTRLLSNLETDRQKLLQIILVGQPELEQTLQKHELRQLEQRISIRHCLGVLKFDEMREYVSHRLMIANGEGQLHFKDGALKKLYNQSKGYPRLINIFCDRALLEAYGQRSHVISKSIMNLAVRDVNGNGNRNGSKSWWKFW